MSPPLVSSATATPASGTIRRNAFWPMVLPSWPMIAPSAVSKRSKPRPHEVPIRPRSGQLDLLGVHPSGGAGREHLGAVGGLAVVHVHLGELEQVARAHAEHRAGRRVRAGEGPHRGGLVAGARLELDVADRGAEHDRLVRVGRGVGQAERREQVLAQAGVVVSSRGAPRPGGRARRSRRCCRRTARRPGTAAAPRG